MKHFAFVLILAGALLAGCRSLPERPVIQYTGDPIVDGLAELAAASEKDKVLWHYRIAATAMRLGRYDEARRQLDSALPLIGGILANSEDARRARSLFSPESTKTFIGEPYERVMAYYYRAILYWMDGEPDNARACYRSAQLIDGDAVENVYKSDYVLLDYLEALANAKLAADPADALARARKNDPAALPPIDPQANVLFFVEYGRGPEKYAAGPHGQQLKFLVQDSRICSARITVGDQVLSLPTLDDLNFQATTRGGRVMDHILGNKAVFKETTAAVGDIALTGAIIAAENMHRRDGSTRHNTENVAIALGIIGIFSKIASSATIPTADVRAWNNLPQRLAFAALRLPAGQYSALIEFLDANGNPLSVLNRPLPITVRTDGDTAIFISEHKR